MDFDPTWNQSDADEFLQNFCCKYKHGNRVAEVPAVVG
jgi:hypothetical protein